MKSKFCRKLHSLYRKAQSRAAAISEYVFLYKGGKICTILESSLQLENVPPRFVRALVPALEVFLSEKLKYRSNSTQTVSTSASSEMTWRDVERATGQHFAGQHFAEQQSTK